MACFLQTLRRNVFCQLANEVNTPALCATRHRREREKLQETIPSVPPPIIKRLRRGLPLIRV